MILYKYLTVKKADEWLIGENSILLTPPQYLNDLLEFRVRREPTSGEERREMYALFQTEIKNPMPFEEFERWITSEDYINTEAAAMQHMLSGSLGVVSLTQSPTDELMWAHYGLNSGVAVGYQSEDVLKQNGINGTVTPLGPALEVEYSNQLKRMSTDFSDAPRQLSTKRECWSYEKEWRIFGALPLARKVTRDSKTYYALDAQREKIAHVVFGANAETDFIDRVKNWLGDVAAQTQKVTINHSSHELELSDI